MFFVRSGKKRKELPDQELISRYKSSGDTSYVGTLFERYAHLIYIICKKYLKDEEEARDASMEVFEYLMTEVIKYEIQNFKSWLARATSNFCLMRLRKKKSLDAKEEDFKKSEIDSVEFNPMPHPISESETKEQELQRLEAALEELNSEQKDCLELFFLKGKSYQEVSDLTGFTYKQVKSYIQNGKRNLRSRLSQEK